MSVAKNSSKRQISDEKFNLLMSETDALGLKFEAFVSECEEKSEVCQYLGLFESNIMVAKQMATADREGNWSLHVAAFRASMKILRAFDCINYLRYASWYLERIEVLEFEHADFFSRSIQGQCVVKNRESGIFTDMKLGQTINRSEKGPGGHVIVGSLGATSTVAELLFHDRTGITNLLNSLTNEGIIKHLEATNVHHELGGRKTIIFYTNVARLFDCLQSQHNQIVITSLNVHLHNIVTQQMVATEVTCRLLKAFKTG